jgi:alkanesulfonate monooxygenase SsuD/methylene tetrahydromethanopterin reductase-like flavin-dependent oxidoreductase (luciferase family)
VADLVIRFDLRAPAGGTAHADLYAACLDMSEWADDQGFTVVQVAEHHAADDGYLPSPLVLAAGIAARTRWARLRVAALLLPLHDPVRVAEDVAVLDQVSAGRVELVIGAGYRTAEFAMYGVDPKARGRRVEEGIEVLKQAWTGEPFDYQGRPVRVTPRPVQQPHPTLMLGGSSVAAARRAARFGLRFLPTNRDLYDAYVEACREFGTEAHPFARQSLGYLFVAADPDAAWAKLGPHAAYEANSYAAWLAEGGTTGAFEPVDDLDAFRTSGPFKVVTPEECIEIVRTVDPAGAITLHPLVGGIEPEFVWESLELFASRVLPEVRDVFPSPAR